MAGKARKIAAGVIGLLFVALLAGVLSLQSRRVQTRIGEKLISKFTANLDGRVSFSSVKVMPAGSVLIKDLTIIDINPYHDSLRAVPPADTLFYGQTIAATFTLKGLFAKEGLHLRRLSIDNASFHLTDDPRGPRNSNIQRMFNLPYAKEVPQETGNIFDIRKVRGTGLEYYMTLYKSRSDWTRPGLHMADFHVTAPVVEGHAVKFTKGRLHAVLDRMEWKEEGCGLEIRSMTGRCKVGMGQTIVEDFHIMDRWSEINLSSYTMDYRNARAFRNFVDEVKIGCTLAESTASAKTIAILTGAFKDSDLIAEIKGGRFDGHVNGFTLKDLVLKDRSSGVGLTFDASVKGITSPKKAQMSLKAVDMRFTTSQLAHLLSGIAGEKVNVIEQYATGQNLILDCAASGVPDRMNAECRLRLEDGSAAAEALVTGLLSRRDSLSISGHVETSELDMSALTTAQPVGKLSLSSYVRAVLGHGGPHIVMDSVKVDRINFKGNDFSGITADGSLSNGTVKARVESKDPKLALSLDGRYDIKAHRGYKAYKLSGNIYDMDLKTLGLDRREGPSNASATVFADFLDHSGMLMGDAQIEDISLTNSTGQHRIGGIMVGAHMYDGRQGLNLSSDFADASFTGSKAVTRLVSDIKRLVFPQAFPSLVKDGDGIGQDCGDYEIGLNFHDSRDLMAFIKPGVYIADSTRISISVDSGRLSGGITSPRLALGSKNMKDTRISFDNAGDALNVSVAGSRLSTGAMSWSNPILNATAVDDSMMATLRYDGFSDTEDDGEINLEGRLIRDSSDTLAVRIGSRNSYMKIGGGMWDLSDADVLIRGKKVKIGNFAITNGEQQILVDGGIARNETDTLGVRVDNLQLDVFDSLLPHSYGFEGIADGKAYIRSPFGEAPDMLMNIGCESLRIGGADAGSVKMAGKWDDTSNRFGVSLSNFLNGHEALYAHLSYAPRTKEVEANALLDNFSLKAAAPFLSQIFSETDGGIRGGIRASGTVGDIKMESRNLSLDNVMLKVAYTGVPYTLNGPVTITSDKVRLDGISVTDGGNGSGSINGILHHNQLKDFRMEAQVNFENMLVMDMPGSRNGSPYGHLRASGGASVHGPFNALQIDASVASSGEGDIHVGMSGALSSNGPGNLLTFAEKAMPTDPYDEMLMQLEPKQNAPSDLSARAKVSVGPGLRAFVEIDREAGNVISFNGSGNVNLDFRPAKDQADLNGDYTINEGNYTFVIPGILKRDFIIKNGSAVKFSGDLMDSDLDIQTVYNLKTSLSTLIADSTVVASRRLVECGIGISGKLNSPEIGFGINVPDLDPTTRNMVESALNTEDKVQKQFVALLLMGSFLPSEASGIFNGTSMLYSNAADIFSNQLSNILQKLEIPLDLGFDYQGLQSGTSIFDVAISTELFNNRVVVNGSVGNRRYSTSTNPNGDMVGDLDIQVKLDQPGNVRFSVFSHSADEYTSYLDYSQRNGIGLSYQKEYNKFPEFIRSMFTGKGKKARKALTEPVPAKEDIIIKIENEQRQTVSDTLSSGR